MSANAVNTGASEARTYGNWRRARGLGIGRLSLAQTVVLFGCLLAPILTAYLFGVLAALPVLGLAGLVVGLLVVRMGGSTPADVLARMVRFARARSRGWAELSGGVLTDHPRRHDLPGVMAPMVPIAADDGRGGSQGMLWNRRTGMLTVVLRVAPLGIELADPAGAEQWVANWGAFLADLGYRPMVRHVAVTVESYPSGGSTSRDYIAERISADAPEAAQQVMGELIRMTPESVADVSTRVAITFDPAAANPKPANLLDAVAEVTRWLPGIEHMLGPCGIALTGRLSARELVAILRTAYDPASRADVARAATDDTADELVRWEDAGPVRASESWDYWAHDSAVSVAWALSEAPRQAVVSRVLMPLLSPGAYARRVTLVYEPFPAERAAAALEAEVTNTAVRREWRKRTKKDATQRDRDDEAQARQATREESAGAGVGRFTLYGSTSVPTTEQLPSAIADLEQRAGQAKVRLRRLRGAHAAGFAAALGMGSNPSEASTSLRG